jgi:hypothetical protein
MKNHFIAVTILLSVSLQNVYAFKNYNPDPERLMTLFLKTMQNNNQEEVQQFIRENYSKKFLEIPMEIHVKVIDGLRKDFSRYIITQTTEKGNKITVIIKSPVNKMKQVTLETDGQTPAKIFIIDIKDAH